MNHIKIYGRLAGKDEEELLVEMRVHSTLSADRRCHSRRAVLDALGLQCQVTRLRKCEVLEHEIQG